MRSVLAGWLRSLLTNGKSWLRQSSGRLQIGEWRLIRLPRTVSGLWQGPGQADAVERISKAGEAHGSAKQSLRGRERTARVLRDDSLSGLIGIVQDRLKRVDKVQWNRGVNPLFSVGYMCGYRCGKRAEPFYLQRF
jgi:hypothetical protein